MAEEALISNKHEIQGNNGTNEPILFYPVINKINVNKPHDH